MVLRMLNVFLKCVRIKFVIYWLFFMFKLWIFVFLYFEMKLFKFIEMNIWEKNKFIIIKKWFKGNEFMEGEKCK